MLWFKDNKSNTFNDLQLFLVSLIISAVLLFVYSKNSIIYPMNDYCDENIFFSVTDALFHGKVLYRDIFEHKGPFLYLIYGVAHILGNSYFTLYLFECIANALYVYFGTKTILLYDNEATKFRTLLYALCLELCLCTSTTFMFGGTVEEIYLWMSSYGLYVTLRCLKNEQYYMNKEIVMIGLLCGALFWTKHSLLGFYSGLAFYVIGWNIAEKHFKRLGKTIALFLGGFAIASMPTVLYCSITRSFADMVDVYFIGNIWGNITTSSSMAHMYALMNNIYKDIAIVIFILFGSFYVLKNEHKSIKLLLLTTILPAFLASCCLKVLWTYYPMPMLAFIAFGIIACRNIEIRRELKVGLIALVLILHLFASMEFGVYSPIIGNEVNLDWVKEHVRVLAKAAIPLLLLYIAFRNHKHKDDENSINVISKYACILTICVFAGFGIRDPFYFTMAQEIPQKRFAKAIKQVEHANILVYGSYDYGFFKSSNTWPQVKHFCNFNLDNDEFKLKQIDYIKKEVIDFIITTQEISNEVDGTSFKLINSFKSYYYNGYTKTFYLYGKTKTNSDALTSIAMVMED